ncbi:MAG: porin family protein [Bacteroidales bacterium]|nr:porin family protein [Bacteroidales bacterium]
MKENTRKEMQQKMAAYKGTAPEVSWAELDKAMAAGRKAAILPIWWRTAAVAAAILLFAGIGWQMFRPVEQNTDIIADNTTAPAQAEEVIVPEENTQTIDTDENIKRVVAKAVEKTVKEEKAEETKEENTGETAVTKTEEKTEVKAEEPEETKEKAETAKEKVERIEIIEGPETGLRKQKKLVASVFIGNPHFGSSDKSMPMMMNNDAPYGFPSQLDDLGNGPLPIYGQTSFKEEAKHRQPVRFGVSLRYNLNERWSVDAGLSYSMLASDITLTIRGNSMKAEQRLSYIGIPAGVNYNLWKNERFNFYASAGGVVEKMVKGRRDDEKISIKPLQYSVSCGTGAEIIFGGFSIYAEPGLSYHFDNGCEIPTFYKDEPLSFNLNLGLRFNL